jgi:hypothetical protein
VRSLIAALLVGLALAGCTPAPPVDEVMPVVGVLQLSVRDEQDRPLAGAAVTGPFVEAAMTDATGRVLVRGYARSSQVLVRLPGYEDLLLPEVPIVDGASVQAVLKRRP